MDYFKDFNEYMWEWYPFDEWGQRKKHPDPPTETTPDNVINMVEDANGKFVPDALYGK
jgi:hypothetical protein